MPFFGLGLHILIALFFAVHAIKNGRQMYWIIILFSFPLLGSIVYFFAEYLSSSTLERGVKNASSKAIQLIDPSKELREARQDFDLTSTIQNRMRLAAALNNAGEYAEAEKEFDEKDAQRMSQKILSNEFSLEDFKSQMMQMQKLGSFSDILGMLPNMGKMGGMINSGDVDDKKIKYTIAIINSMTKQEKEHPKIINGRRRLRISKGCGRPVMEINQLLKNYQQMKKMMKKPFLKKMMKKFDFSG